MGLRYLIDVVRDMDPTDAREAEVEEAEALEDHFRGMGWDARRIEEESGEKVAA